MVGSPSWGSGRNDDPTPWRQHTEPLDLGFRTLLTEDGVSSRQSLAEGGKKGRKSPFLLLKFIANSSLELQCELRECLRKVELDLASDTKTVFISYRRDESAGYVGRIADSFVAHFGEDKVFRAFDSLGPGLGFVEAIERAIESSEVLNAVIGKSWLTATDAAGRKRLENPHDYVRMEIATALKRTTRVIPLLVQDSAMPSARVLPDDLAPLSRRNAFEIYDSSWREDIWRLVTTLDRVIKGNRLPTLDEVAAIFRRVPSE